jgi:hypothetical protein
MASFAGDPWQAKHASAGGNKYISMLIENPPHSKWEYDLQPFFFRKIFIESFSE